MDEISVPMSYIEPPLVVNIEKESIYNPFYRHVIYTDGNIQLVLMKLEPGEEIGSEVHPITTQFIRCESGIGYAEINNLRYTLSDGIAVVIPFGSQHNIVNTSFDKPMNLYTIYSPPHHSPEKIDIIK